MDDTVAAEQDDDEDDDDDDDEQLEVEETGDSSAPVTLAVATAAVGLTASTTTGFW